MKFRKKLSFWNHVDMMTVEINYSAEGELSITGQTSQSAGQCIDELGNYTCSDIDIPRIKSIWERWHLNHLNAGCEHQRSQWDTSEKVELITYKLTSDGLRQKNEVKRQAEQDLKEKGTVTLSDLNKELIGLPWETTKAPETHKDLYKEEKRETKAVGWVHQTEHPKGLLCRPCETCGYEYGTRWLKEEIPADVLTFLSGLPEMYNDYKKDQRVNP